MDPFDDYMDEVELSDAQIEAILSGQDHSSRPVTTLVRDIRVGLLEYPSPEITARHVGAMAQASRPPAPHGAAAPAAKLDRRNVLPRRRLAAMVLAAALLLVAGLAAAVTLPRKTAQTPEDTVPTTAPSVSPPAQDFRDEAGHGQAVSDVAKDRSLTGCEKGQAVADVASAKAAGKGKGARENDPCARTGNQGKPDHERPGEARTGRDQGSKGRDDSHPAGGAGPGTAPGLGDEGAGGSQAGAGGGRETPDSGGVGGAGGYGGGGDGGGSKAGGGGVPEDLPTP